MKSHSSRQPRERSQNSPPTFSLVKTSSADQEIDAREEEDQLGLSPQPSIISTVTHGASQKKKNSLARGDKKPISYGASSTPRPPLIIEPNRRVSSAPVPQFGDVLFPSRKEAGTETESDHSRQPKSLEINSSQIEEQLLDQYPGVPKVLDDSLDNDPLDSFYYVSWNDDIYDQQFDDFGQVGKIFQQNLV